MRYLVIYSHPNPQSFNAAIKDTLVRRLEKKGREVRVRDLYAMHFDPVLKADELAGFPDKVFPEDVRVEHEHIRWADMLIFICPVWWGGFTAQLRGYCDRVFCLNFAYEETDSGPRGLLSDKEAVTINTLGSPLHLYLKAGMIRSMNQIYDDGFFKFCGIQVRVHHYFGGIGETTPEERAKILGNIEAVADALAIDFGKA